MSDRTVTSPDSSQLHPEEKTTGVPLWKRIRFGFRTFRDQPLTQPEQDKRIPTLSPSDDRSKSPISGAGADVAGVETVAKVWTLVLSDTDNDFESVRHVLWLTGLCDIQGCWRQGLKPFHLVHTGDWLNKWNPNPYVLDFFKRLRETLPTGCHMTMLLGNHELLTLKMAEMGMCSPLMPGDLEYISRQDIIHVQNGILFLHGYPSMDLLAALQQMHREKIASECFNDRLKKLFFEGRFPLFRETRGLEMIGDIRKPKFYYDQRDSDSTWGGKIAQGLLDLGIHTVVHGHKPQSLVQMDYEYRAEFPGVHLINNDNRVRENGLGALLIGGKEEMIFINKSSQQAAGGEKAFRKKLRKRLATRKKELQPRLTKNTILQAEEVDRHAA